ncbi:glycosyltransferase [Desulfobotulus sp. H1]|uniref:Glycosyltransferase n=1 Tax=Desulfobotulus pelophilus TaxID=2823377 RepID=A0ABT3NBV7_9BACT|nr:glycosyltransferase [Desulfobotulus pelophilus]MCW7754905.1 glycosyltransferase [Desulfobotulus pelophilus]
MSSMYKDQPLVSIAIITYNQKKYLRKCIESVLVQDYPNMEIVVADDCSTDGTQDMLRKYNEQYPGKFVLKLAEKNLGITGNSNVALFACSGKYIALTGGDDVFLPGKISKQVSIMEGCPEVSLCGTYTKLIDSSSSEIAIRKDLKKRSNPFYSLCELLESANSLIPVVSYIFRSKDIPKNGFDYRLPVASDSLFYYHIGSKGKIYVLPDILTCYRIHESHAKNKGYVDDSFVSLALAEFFFPHCYKEIKKARSKSYYTAGRYHHRELDYHLAQLRFKASLNLSFTTKALVAYVLSRFRIGL